MSSRPYIPSMRVATRITFFLSFTMASIMEHTVFPMPHWVWPLPSITLQALSLTRFSTSSLEKLFGFCFRYSSNCRLFIKIFDQATNWLSPCSPSTTPLTSAGSISKSLHKVVFSLVVSRAVPDPITLSFGKPLAL